MQFYSNRLIQRGSMLELKQWALFHKNTFTHEWQEEHKQYPHLSYKMFLIPTSN